MNNKDIRKAIFENNLKKYEIANKMGITCNTFSHWLQVEMTPTKKDRVLKAIEELTKA